jgi:ParB-like chromosome segregation protein Spo0J
MVTTPPPSAGRDAAGEPPPTVRAVELALLRPAPDIRLIDEGHVHVLMDVMDRLPPIVVVADTLTLVDGMHRVEAALRKGRTHLLAEHVELAPGEVLAERIRRNVAHGLPLSVAERKRAAQHLLAEDPARSNALVARLAGVSTSTVRRLRGCPGPPENDLDTVLGLDGKRYSRRIAARREAALTLLRREPGLSDRAIAKQVRLSPTTVGALRRAAHGGRLRRILRSLLSRIRTWVTHSRAGVL